MLPVFLIGFFVLLILFAALRIILSWLLPAKTMAQVDRLVGGTLKLIFQVSIVGLAGILCYAGYLVWKG